MVMYFIRYKSYKENAGEKDSEDCITGCRGYVQ